MELALLVLCVAWCAGLTGYLVREAQRAAARRAQMTLVDVNLQPGTGREALRRRLAVRAAQERR